MKKRGQVSLFTFLGIVVLLVLAGTLFYIRGMGDITVGTASAQSVREAIEACHDRLSVEGAYRLAGHAGYYPLPDLYTQIGQYEVVHYYSHNADPAFQALTKAQIEAFYADYIEQSMPVCVNNFQAFEDLNMEITAGVPRSNVSIQDTNVVVWLTYPVKAGYGGEVTELYKFDPVTVPVRLGLMHRAAVQMTQWIAADPMWVPFSRIDSLMAELGMTFSFETQGRTDAYIIIDPESEVIKNRRYDFVFGAYFG